MDDIHTSSIASVGSDCLSKRQCKPVCVVILNAAHQLSSVKRELETERGKVTQLKRDMEGLKKKSKADQEKAARLVYIFPHAYIHIDILPHNCVFRQRAREQLWKER